MKKRLLTLFTLTAFSTLGHAADLWEIYQLALQNDTAYRIAKLDHESNVIGLPIAETAFQPTVTTSGTVGQQISDITGATRSGSNHSLSLDVGLSLYNRTNKINITQSEFQIAISALRLEDAKHDLMLRVADRYFRLLASRDAKEVAQREKISIRRQMDLAGERLDVGLGTKTDLLDAKARFQQAQADEIEAENLIDNSIAALREIIGTTPKAVEPLSETAPLDFPRPNDADAWVAKAESNNVPLQIEAVKREIAKSEIDKQRRKRTPTVDLGAEYRWSESSTGSFAGQNNTTSVNLTFRFPLYQGGAIFLHTKQAGIRYNLSRERYEQAKRRVSTTTISEFLAVNSRINQVNALSEAIVAGENALEAKEEGFSAGLTTNLDVLDAQRDLSRFRTDYLQARYNYILSFLRLERASGQLDEDDIKRVNSWLSQQR